MRKIVSFVHMSLDGYVSSIDEGHSLGWINLSDEMFGYVEQRVEKTDTALYGRVTYQMMESYWPTAAEQPNASTHDRNHSRWYKTARKIVLSNTLDAKNHSNTQIIGSNLRDEINQIRHSEGSEILVFGSPSATHALMAEDLIDEYWMFVNPIVLGKGIPLFKNIQHRTALTLTDSKVFSTGVVSLQYAVKRSD